MPTMPSKYFVYLRAAYLHPYTLMGEYRDHFQANRPTDWTLLITPPSTQPASPLHRQLQGDRDRRLSIRSIPKGGGIGGNLLAKYKLITFNSF